NLAVELLPPGLAPAIKAAIQDPPIQVRALVVKATNTSYRNYGKGGKFLHSGSRQVPGSIVFDCEANSRCRADIDGNNIHI
ncbi:MAG: hypothetical protein L0H37_03505, partial [Nitrosospira sp.]|nr:hypothetical protein [Nitrosospira sp.]